MAMERLYERPPGATGVEIVPPDRLEISRRARWIPRVCAIARRPATRPARHFERHLASTLLSCTVRRLNAYTVGAGSLSGLATQSSCSSWVHCKVEGVVFKARGGARNLTAMVRLFLAWSLSE